MPYLHSTNSSRRCDKDRLRPLYRIGHESGMVNSLMPRQILAIPGDKFNYSTVLI